MKCSKTFREACRHIHPDNPKRNYKAFYRAARLDLERIAKHLFRRWELPAAVEVEDVIQDLALFAWRCIGGWDPSAAPLDEYVMFNMTDKTKKEIHKQRNAYRRDGSAPGRFEIPESRLRQRTTSDGIEHRCSIVERLAVEPDDESRDAREEGKRLYERVMNRLPALDAELFEQAVEWGFDLDRAAVRVYRSNPRLGLRAQASSVRDVKLRMRRVVERVCAETTATACDAE